MRNKLLASSVLVVFGAAFLFAAYQFAPLAYAAPSTHSGHTSDPTVLEFAYGFPAVVFTVAGVVCVLAGVAIASISLFISEDSR
jgi:hypothetical protein